MHMVALEAKSQHYFDEGVVVGGRSGLAYSLLKVHKTYYGSKEIERIALDLGDLQGKPLKGKPSYFQVSLEKNPARIVIDLAQLSHSAIQVDHLRSILKNSAFIQDLELVADPEDASSSLILKLKKQVQIEVFEIPSVDKPSQIVIDIRVAKNSTPQAHL